MRYNYIAVEGNIGAGKTSLALMLSQEFEAELILESFSENIFLEKFYTEPAKYAFPLEMSFLLERYQQLEKTFYQRKESRVVADYFFDKCLVFAQNNLAEEEFRLYTGLHRMLANELPQPEVILYLHNEIKGLQSNIARRGRTFEQTIEDEYLRQIENGYLEYFEKMEEAVVLYVDISEADFVLWPEKYSGIKELLSKDWPKGISFLKI